MWSKPYKGIVKDPATGKNKLLSEKTYSSKCAYYKVNGKCGWGRFRNAFAGGKSFCW